MAKKDNSELYLFSDTTTTAGEALLTEYKEEESFYNVPSGIAPELVSYALSAGKSQMGEIPQRQELIRSKATHSLTTSGKARQLTRLNGENSINIVFNDIDQLTGNNKSVSKLFTYFLVKTGEQALSDNRLTSDVISFPLKELVENGTYSSIRAARRGIENAKFAIMGIAFYGSIKKGKNNITQSIAATLFPTLYIDNSVVYVRLNTDIMWEAFAPYFTRLPKWAFKLSSKPWDLLSYIFYLARQKNNLDKISKQGYFTISFQAIHSRLVLPEAKYTKNPKRDIKEAIDEAVTEIEELARTSELQFILRYNEKGNIKEYLSEGYLEVHFKGSYALPFLDLYKRNTKRLEQAEKKREQIIEKAKVKNLAKQMEAEAAKEQAEISTEAEPLTV